MNDKMKFNVDWLNIRLDGLESPEQFIDEFLQVFPDLTVAVRECGGVNFYKFAYNVPECGNSSIIFGYNVDENGEYLKEHKSTLPHGLMITVSGDGCRFLNYKKPNGLLEFCKLCAKFDYNVTRIDMACDFLDDTNSIVPMIQLWATQYYVDMEEKAYGLSCNMKKENLVTMTSVYDRMFKQLSYNVTVGQRDSRKGVMQLYNKRVEVENGRLSDIAEKTFEQYGVTDYWWRLEYRCKSFSPAVFENLLAKGVHAAFLCAMDVFGRFYIPKYADNNVSLCPTVDEWEEYRQELLIHLVELGEDTELIEIVSQPYIPADTVRVMKHCNRMAISLYKFFKLAALNPSWYRDVLNEGRRRYYSSTRNLAFENELLANYGFNVDPMVCISIPELEQISMDLVV